MRAYVLVLVAAVVEVLEVGGYTTRSYDLEVPGSRPIRIIEADPPAWNSREHRTEATTQISRRRDSDYEDNSHKLKDFLENYAEGLKRRRPLRDEGEGEDELYLKDVNLPDEEEEEDDEEKDTKRPEKSKSWNMVQAEKHNHPYDDEKGWVSMEAVPWSMSKISKWQSKPKPDKFSNPYGADRYHDYNKPQHDYKPQQHFPQKPAYSKPTYRPMKPTPSYYNEDEDEEEEPDYPLYTNNKKRPQYPRPTATYGQKVHVHTVPPQQKPWEKHDCKHHHHNRPEIITDGLPPDFPDPTFDYANRRRGTSENLPNTHPFKGDVLPPLKDGRVNMTTSHGGLLQVESTFQTVEESQKAFVKKQKLKTKRKPLKIVRPSPTSASYQQLQNYQNYQLEGNRDSSETSDVLAAVGAGMIPASMALLVPMAMNGRRRRDLKVKHPTASPYVDKVELTLPRSF